MSVNPLDISTPLLLLAPADWPAAMRGDDADMPLIFDLHPDGHAAASADAGIALMDFLGRRDLASGSRQVLIRIGGFRDGLAERDLALLETVVPDGILLSACRKAADIQKLDVLLSVIEAGKGMAIGTTAILAECGAEAEFFLSPHSLAGKSARLRGLVLNSGALGELTRSDTDAPDADRTTAPLSFAHAVCVLKAAEACVPCYETPPPQIGTADILKARATSKASGFNDIVARGPAHLAALVAPATVT
jgi:citrate lyase beta subunit